MQVKKTFWKILKWGYLKKHLGYSAEEMKHFRSNPRNENILSSAPTIMSKRIIARVVESHGCNSQHRVGDQFHFDGFGNLLTRRCPKRVCVYAINAIVPQIFAAHELMHAGVDPNEMRFNSAACFDVGVQCGGFGRIAMKIRVVDDSDSSLL
ncbi:MAG: TIGR04076 family protein [Proteobacteria bacterium]|nr:TIGR04076 family protein [Pseudomonadota bacterium]